MAKRVGLLALSFVLLVQITKKAEKAIKSCFEQNTRVGRIVAKRDGLLELLPKAINTRLSCVRNSDG